MADLDRQHRVAQARLAGELSRRLGALLLTLPLEGQEGMDAYSSQAVRLVSGGQRQAASFAIAYLARLNPPALGKLPPSVDRALAGQLVTSDSPVASSPVLRIWARIEEGEEEQVARQGGASYAEGLASGDLHVAERQGLEEGARAGSRAVTGYRKELSGSACEWCRGIAAQVFRSADAVPFHQRDHCSVAPVFE